MVYLKGLFVRTAIVVVLVVVLLDHVDSTKIAYKKPIYGKTHLVKEKRIKFKPQTIKDSSKTMTTIAPATTTISSERERLSGDAVTEPLARPQNATESALEASLRSESANMELKTTSLAYITSNVVDDDLQRPKGVEEPLELQTAPPAPLTTNAPVPTIETTVSNLPVPCTCGVFMASQVRRLSHEPPTGEPVIMNEQELTYPCNAIGQKQCQTKCLETMVQHLPNSANILCATLNRDCRKERAHLFIKNCRNRWVNTNLTAGREYCCKNGKPYPCPLV